MRYIQTGGGYFYKVYKNGKKKRISRKDYKLQKGGIGPLDDNTQVMTAIQDAENRNISVGQGLDRGAIGKKLRFVFKLPNNEYLVVHKNGTKSIMDFKIVSSGKSSQSLHQNSAEASPLQFHQSDGLVVLTKNLNNDKLVIGNVITNEIKPITIHKTSLNNFLNKVNKFIINTFHHKIYKGNDFKNHFGNNWKGNGEVMPIPGTDISIRLLQKVRYRRATGLIIEQESSRGKRLLFYCLNIINHTGESFGTSCEHIRVGDIIKYMLEVPYIKRNYGNEKNIANNFGIE